MGLAFGDAGPQWQHRATSGPALGSSRLLIDAKHLLRFGGGIQIQPHHVNGSWSRPKWGLGPDQLELSTK